MKRHDEIKDGLEHCAEDGCKKCPYEDDCNMADGFSVLAADALAYIQQLEADNAELLTKVEQLQAERDALISDFEQYDELPCALCEHYSKEESDIPCKICKNLATPTDEDKVSQWEWRGVQKEE